MSLLDSQLWQLDILTLNLTHFLLVRLSLSFLDLLWRHGAMIDLALQPSSIIVDHRCLRRVDGYRVLRFICQSSNRRIFLDMASVLLYSDSCTALIEYVRRITPYDFFWFMDPHDAIGIRLR